MNNIISEIKVSNNIVLLCHINPDGDAIGSTLAMSIVLKRLGKEVDIVIDNPPRRFRFIPEYNSIKYQSNKKYDTAIVLDTGSIERVNSSYILENVNKVLVIDHHKTNTRYGNVNLVEDYPACCEVVYNLIRKMNITIDEELGVPLAVGLLTDTGGFANANVLPSTFAMAEELSKVVNISKIYKLVLRTISLNQFNIKKIALNNLEFYQDNKLAISYITEEDMKSNNVSEDDCGILVNIPLEIDTIEVSILLRKYSNSTRVSLRSNNIDVSKIASLLGGGGHINAAGITTNMPFDELKERLIKEVGKEIEKWNINNK